MSGILERTLVLGKVMLSGKRERLVPFPWSFVSGGVANGWEPSEWNPMGRISNVNRLMRGSGFDVLASSINIIDGAAPYFYDENGTVLHGGYVQTV